MYQFKIGAMVESFKTELFTAMRTAAALGVDGLQMYCSRGQTTPELLTPDRIREIKQEMKNNGLVFSAICGDLGKGFGDPTLNPDLIERSKRIVDLALELGTNIITTHIGVVPTDKAHPRYKIMQEACGTLAEYADSVGAFFAVETGPEKSIVLKEFLDSLGSRGVSVNLDPANLVMVVQDNPVEAVYNLRDYIVHTHAKDGRMLRYKDPEYVYRVTPMPEGMEKYKSFRELPLGEGDVDFPAYLKALDDIGYHGYLTIEREVGDNPGEDIANACTFLRNLI